MSGDRLSKHFHRHEFACRCGCGADTVDAELITVLEDLRAWAQTQIEISREYPFEAKVLIDSGMRCPKHNAAIGGVPNSQHLVGKAADVRVTRVASKDVAKYLEHKYPDTHGIGRYHNFTHIDVRHKKARWRK